MEFKMMYFSKKRRETVFFFGPLRNPPKGQLGYCSRIGPDRISIEQVKFICFRNSFDQQFLCVGGLISSFLFHQPIASSI